LHDFVSRDLTTRFTVSANELVFKHRLKTATRQWFICDATTIKIKITKCGLTITSRHHQRLPNLLRHAHCDVESGSSSWFKEPQDVAGCTDKPEVPVVGFDCVTIRKTDKQIRRNQWSRETVLDGCGTRNIVQGTNATQSMRTILSVASRYDVMQWWKISEACKRPIRPCMDAWKQTLVL